MKIKIKKNDQVIVIAGKDKGKIGKVLKIFPAQLKILVEGINIRKKHQRAKSARTKGQIIEIPTPLDISKIMLICPRCSKSTRIGYSLVGDTKYRICRKCKNQI